MGPLNFHPTLCVSNNYCTFGSKSQRKKKVHWRLLCRASGGQTSLPLLKTSTSETGESGGWKPAWLSPTLCRESSQAENLLWTQGERRQFLGNGPGRAWAGGRSLRGSCPPRVDSGRRRFSPRPPVAPDCPPAVCREPPCPTLWHCVPAPWP